MLANVTGIVDYCSWDIDQCVEPSAMLTNVDGKVTYVVGKLTTVVGMLTKWL